MKPKILIMRLLGLLLIAVLVNDTEATAQPIADIPCRWAAGCILCQVSNQDCEILFCGDHIHTDCDFGAEAD